MTSIPFSIIAVLVILLHNCWIHFVAGAAYYIIPSVHTPHTPCLEESCLSLHQFAANTDHFDPNVSLIFLPGYHSLDTNLTVPPVIELSMRASSTLSPSPIIFCREQASITFYSVDVVNVSHLKFVGCRGHQVTLVNTYLLEAVVFVNHTESVLQFLPSSTKKVSSSYTATQQVIVSIKNSVFEGNRGRYGGVFYIEDHVDMVISNSNFSRNHAAKSGGVVYVERVFAPAIDIFVTSSIFSNNSAGDTGGGIAVTFSNNNVTLSEVKFLTNKARLGGAVFVYSVKLLLISSSSFIENYAKKGGAITCITRSNVTIDGGELERNGADIGVAYVITSSYIAFFRVLVSNNTANRAIMYILQSVGYLSDVTFVHNTGSLFVHLGNLTFSGTITMNNSSVHLKSTQEETFPEGGAITAIQASVAFVGVCSLNNNYADSGGALYASKSRVHIYANISITHNMATSSGGGIYLQQTGLTCYSKCTIDLVKNKCGYEGGGIYATSSFLTSEDRTRVTLKENEADFAGGGIYLEQSSKLSVQLSKHAVTIFINNSADYGGAVYVADETNSGTCESKSFEQYSTKTECFIELLPDQSGFYNDAEVTVFEDNHAYISGADLFGGLLDRCTISPLAVMDNQQSSVTVVNFMSSLFDVYSLDISSAPIRVCFCDEDKQPDCSYHPPIVNVKKGGIFLVSLVAVDQVNKTVSNVAIHSSLSSSFGWFGDNGHNQSTGEGCADLMFEVFSPLPSEQLILYADGPCKDAPLSQGIVNINFISCDCPIGFQQKLAMKTRCECECDPELGSYDSKCNPEAETIMREGNFWIDYFQRGRSYVIHPHCPFDYCRPSSEKIAINLNINGGANTQCANDRSGTLCGQCSIGTSLSIGNSHCIKCPTYWPLLTVVLLMASVLAGVLFVAIVLSLNLTVAIGTLNGVIFYANIVAASTNSVFPSNVVIAWLNLEPGINMCFFDGMTTYWKVWLQLAFPSYVIVLVVLVILISERSKRFCRLIGRKDPVATLATLVLFSYAKLLHTIIASLSGTVLKYPGVNGTHDDVIVWLPDASIEYLSAKHIPLFTVALVILVAGTAYTMMLFCWQCHGSSG